MYRSTYPYVGVGRERHLNECVGQEGHLNVCIGRQGHLHVGADQQGHLHVGAGQQGYLHVGAGWEGHLNVGGIGQEGHLHVSAGREGHLHACACLPDVTCPCHVPIREVVGTEVFLLTSFRVSIVSALILELKFLENWAYWTCNCYILTTKRDPCFWIKSYISGCSYSPTEYGGKFWGFRQTSPLNFAKNDIRYSPISPTLVIVTQRADRHHNVNSDLSAQILAPKTAWLN